VAWDDEEGAGERHGPELVKLIGDQGSSSTMIFTIVPEQNSWRIKVVAAIEGHPAQVMMLDGWYPSKFAAVQDLPMVVNAAKSKGWKEEP
jgi:hypothetical protein